MGCCFVRVIGDIVTKEKTLTSEEMMCVTICTKCKHFKNLEPDSPRKDVWYNHLCQVNKLPVEIDPYDGVEKPHGKNDLGIKYASDTPFKYCRDCNNGICQEFEQY